MEIGVKVQAVRGDITKTGGPLVAVNLYQGVKKPQGATLALDTALDGLIGRALDAGDFKGGRGEKLLLYPEAKKGLPERVLLLGLGDKDTFDAEAARAVGGAFADACRQLKVKKAATVVHGGDSGKPVDDLARGLVEGLLLGLYRYDNWFRDGRAQELALTEVSIVEKLAGKMARVRRGVETGVEVALAVNTARELANGPSNEVTPSHIAEAARTLGRKHGFKVQVFDADRCAKEGMGAFLGVAKGSDEPCKFLIMEYAPSRPRGTVCFVGKGITFDSGGISIKPAAEMDKMKFDMSGAAAVLGAMRYAASRKVPVKVVGLVAATENLPGGHAYKPGDILTSSAGVTIEVLNTDAEGRLVLSDALNYARKFEPDAVIDLATLTGACVIALGEHAAGLMANDEWILDQVFEAGVGSGERVWPLPLWSEYRNMVKSEVADIRNTAGRAAGTITAGAFLGAFTNDYRWAHLDIAGTAWDSKARNYLTGASGTGAGVRVLAEFLNRWKKPKGAGGPKPGPRTSLRELSQNGPAPVKKAPPRTRKKAAKKKAGRKRGKKR